ncbi:hypothetical protein [Vibrio barjaei]|uniref:hypothetical protein n=1 Tax=Vibrio barjaei TaxID=1676683 RepID=UPI0022853AA1|nr:hypothetical protein [Vibrio barjaei]MCY9874483.1 hypothetical protein [Vibrio barjaei]
MKKYVIIGLSTITFSSLCFGDEYLSNTREHAPAPISPNLTNSDNSINNKDEDSELDLIWRGVESSFELPFGELKDREGLSGLSGNFSLNLPLIQTQDANLPSGATNGPSNVNYTANLSLKYVLIGNWFASGTLYYYFDKDQQQTWNPDFTYVFGYSDWRPYTFSLLYSNYGGNRFSPEPGGSRTNFDEGTVSLGWKFPITGKLLEWTRVSDDGSIGCQVDYNWTPSYFDLASSSYKTHHRTASLGCKYAIFGNWYVNATAFYYFDKSQQQPWNPDYTYGFGYFDWRPGTITLQYNNYSGNRWNPSNAAEGTGRFLDGSITLAYSFAF